MTYSRRVRFGDGKSGLPRVEFAAELNTRVAARGSRRSGPVGAGRDTGGEDRRAPRGVPDGPGGAPGRHQLPKL